MGQTNFRGRTVAAVMLMAVVLGAGCSQSGPDSSIPDRAGIDSWLQNGSGGRYVVPVIEGPADAVTRTTQGIVRTDSNCAPDSRGLSHCHNIIDLGQDVRIQIQNNHRMSEHRCLRVGERVTLRPLQPGWVVVQVRSL